MYSNYKTVYADSISHLEGLKFEIPDSAIEMKKFASDPEISQEDFISKLKTRTQYAKKTKLLAACGESSQNSTAATMINMYEIVSKNDKDYLLFFAYTAYGKKNKVSNNESSRFMILLNNLKLGGGLFVYPEDLTPQTARIFAKRSSPKDLWIDLKKEFDLRKYSKTHCWCPKIVKVIEKGREFCASRSIDPDKFIRMKHNDQLSVSYNLQPGNIAIMEYAAPFPGLSRTKELSYRMIV